MIFWIFVFALCAGIVFSLIGNFNLLDVLELLGWILTVVGAFAVSIMLVIIIISHILAPSYEAQNRIRYETLKYKVEAKEYRDEFGILNKSILDEVQEWNEDLTGYRVKKENFWIGIFYPNNFDGLKIIDISEIQY